MGISKRTASSSRQSQKGFTIVEITICVVVITVLASITGLAMSGALFNSRDKQRSSKVTILSEALEKYYQQYGEYPTCASLTQPSSTVTSTILKGLDSDVLTAPGAAKGTNSISCGANTVSTFVYNLDDSGAYTITYSKEQDGKSVTVDSRYNGGTLLGDVDLSLSVVNETRIRLSWASV